MVRSAMVDMSRKGGGPRLSDVVARRVLRELRRNVPVHAKHVHRAGFAVLKTRNIPSLLIETAFLSNPTDEKLLRDERYQRRIRPRDRGRDSNRSSGTRRRWGPGSPRATAPDRRRARPSSGVGRFDDCPAETVLARVEDNGLPGGYPPLRGIELDPEAVSSVRGDPAPADPSPR